MPLIQKTMYLRPEDVPMWEALKNKSAWLHEHLNQHEPAGTATYQPATRPTSLSRPIPMASRSGWCKEHGMEKEFCKLMKHKKGTAT